MGCFGVQLDSLLSHLMSWNIPMASLNKEVMSCISNEVTCTKKKKKKLTNTKKQFWLRYTNIENVYHIECLDTSERCRLWNVLMPQEENTLKKNRKRRENRIKMQKHQQLFSTSEKVQKHSSFIGPCVTIVIFVRLIEHRFYSKLLLTPDTRTGWWRDTRSCNEQPLINQALS